MNVDVRFRTRGGLETYENVQVRLAKTYICLRLARRDASAYVAAMVFDLIRRLTGPEPQPLPEPDARTALAALLVRVARADGDYASEEVAQIDRILVTRYELSPFEATRLRREAEALEAEAPDTVRFTRALKDAVAYEDRTQLVESLWEIVLADGERDPEENALLRTVAPLLGVTDQDSAVARQRAEKKG